MQNTAALATAGQMGMGNIMEIFKMQVLMKYMGDAKTPQASFVFMFIMMMYDNLAKHFPALALAFWVWVQARWFKPKTPANMMKPLVEPPKAKSIRAFIQFEKDAASKVVDPRIDAVMNYVCQLPEVRSLRFNGSEFIPNFSEPLMIDTDVWFEITANAKVSVPGQGGTTATAETLVYKLSSYDHDITYLHRFVQRSIENFEQEKKNKLGSETYYFDQVVSVGSGRMKIAAPSGICAFRKSKFQSNRSLDNIYIRQIDELRGRVEFFLRRRDWYDSKGIPHTLGIMMWGHPGCGKTSTIKAIANETKRHIFNVSLSEIKTKDALKELFYSDTVHVFTGEKIEQLTIPLKQRLYVIEDVDAMNSVVIKRGFLNQVEETAKQAEKQKRSDVLKKLGREDEADDDLDLSTLLNVLDGVRETPGRIIILSTNYPERLDEALLRPGRFDVILEYEKHSHDVLKMHIERFYDISLSEAQVARIYESAELDKKWTPAEASQILFKNITSVDAALDDLILKSPSELFRFSQMKAVGVVAEGEGEIVYDSEEGEEEERSEKSGGSKETGVSEKSEETTASNPKVTLDMEEYAKKKGDFWDFYNNMQRADPSEEVLKELDERITFRDANTQPLKDELANLTVSPAKGTQEELKAISQKVSELTQRIEIRNKNTNLLKQLRKEIDAKSKSAALEKILSHDLRSEPDIVKSDRWARSSSETNRDEGWGAMFENGTTGMGNETWAAPL